MRARQAADDLARRLQVASPEDDLATLRAALEAELEEVSRQPDEYPAWRDGVDVPGTAYEAAVRSAVRRTAGQFQTPFWAADVMAGWLLREKIKLLLDPGVGAGRLLFRTWQRPELGPEELLGLDIDPLYVAMARLNLSLRGVENFAVRESDFFRARFRQHPDALIANPPFSRHHELDADEKERIHGGIERRLGLRLSRRAGLHALFLVRALEVAADDARLAFIAPADWLDTDYGEAIKRFVLESGHVEALVLFNRADTVFEGVRTRPAIMLLRKGAERTETHVLRLPAARPSAVAVLGALEGESDRLRGRHLVLSAKQKWADPRATRRAKGRTLSEIARVRRGIATGRNKFFVLSEAERRRRALAVEDLRSCLSSPRLIENNEVNAETLSHLGDDVPRWIIDVDDPDAEDRGDALGRYLEQGRELGAADSYLAANRHPWYAPEKRDRCPILFPYMNAKRPRFIRNRTNAVPLNTFLIIEPADGVDADALWRALNGSAVLKQLKQLAREYGDGMWKLEPSELARVRVNP